VLQTAESHPSRLCKGKGAFQVPAVNQRWFRCALYGDG
jgi:hypothetical protein